MRFKSQLLVIDSSESVLRLLFNVLSDEFDVVLQRSPVNAYQWLHDGHFPAVAVVDLDAVEGGGFSLLNTLRISGLYRKLPVVLLLSSAAPPNAVQKAHISQADACFSKPFDPSKLQDAVRNLIPRRHTNVAA